MLGLAGLAQVACDQAWINSSDRIAQKIIKKRQMQTLGATSDTRLPPEDGTDAGGTPYDFTPHPVDSEVPEAFLRPPPEPVAAETAAMDTNGLAGDVGSPGLESVNTMADMMIDTSGLRPFTLAEALAYAFRHAWDFQTQKEDLYLAALALMTERQLWTPQLEGEIRARYTNYGQVRQFDQAMAAVSELAVSQRLPYGGDVSARIINTLMRDIGNHTTTGETGDAILQANIPLLKGAGRVAFESRFQAERNLIYAVRNFETNRRLLTVDVAGNFFDLLAIKTRIDSAQAALNDAEYDLSKVEAQVAVGEVVEIEAQRTRVQMLDSRNNLINAQVQYQNALDRFKIRIGMPTAEPIDAVDSELELFEPFVQENEATAAALKYRLDLINQLDFIDDARRGVRIARNNFLPAFNFTGTVSMATDPNRTQSFSYNTERTTWDALLTLELPFDRREERNNFRASLIDLRRAQREFELASQNVKLDVRAALRNLRLARESMEIQRQNMLVNQRRNDMARVLWDRGEMRSSRDLVEAQNALQQSTNQYAAATADYRLAILVLLRDTGTLRVGDDGHWVR
ncbi:MAG TPA: TolC family protein, partial [Phycisphaerae bacterium]|nr:TolC family protein [Phycisphaerae bacterium]